LKRLKYAKEVPLIGFQENDYYWNLLLNVEKIFEDISIAFGRAGYR
jgi:hypothetical protein